MKKLICLLFLVLTNLYGFSQCEWKPKLQNDLYESDELSQALFENADLVDSWKVVFKGKTSLRSVENLNKIDVFKKSNSEITYNAIKNAFESIKSSGTRRQAFINALKSCADNDKLIESLQKTKLATVEEIKDALNKVRDYKKGKPESGNLGYLEGHVAKIDIDNKMWKSGVALEGEPQIFEAIEVQGGNGNSWLRNTDSEYKMLNQLAVDLGGEVGNVYANIRGTLKIVSENPYCTSCQGVVQQFNEMFPNIEIILIDGVK